MNSSLPAAIISGVSPTAAYFWTQDSTRRAAASDSSAMIRIEVRVSVPKGTEIGMYGAFNLAVGDK